MLNTLVRHALASVWCTPFQDAQALFGLSRATAYGGARDYVSIQKQRIKLPNSTDRFHVYQIGQNNPGRFELDLPASQWFTLSEVCSKLDKVIELYTVDGEQFCRVESYVIYTQAKTFLLAVRIHAGTADLNTDKLYFRTYSNAFFDSVRSDTLESAIRTNGRMVQTVHQSVLLQNEFHTWRAKAEGYAFAFHNGRYVNDFPPGVIKPGDSVEWFYDGSIYRVVDLKLNDLLTFTSELDNGRKYLLHPPKYHNEIDYRDDLDFWIIQKEEDGRVDGVYYHKNAEVSVRMVTHADYALPVQLVQAYLDANPQWDLDKVFIRIHYRNSGYSRPLVFEHNRIHELYKLTDAEIVAAMIGVDSTVPNWRAERLEQSNYTRIMRSLQGQVTGQEVYSAYGYNAAASLVAQSPLPVVGGEVVLPAATVVNSTVYEYDAQGKLLGYRIHNSGSEYVPQFAQTTMVEAVVGLGRDWFPYADVTGPVTLDPLQSHRFYACLVLQGVPNNEWVDVTNDIEFVTYSNGVATPVFDPDAFVMKHVSTSHFVAQSLDLEITDNVLNLTLSHREPGNHQIAWIPLGKLELWLNGSALIENIDYYVQWPEVVVVNKAYLDLANPTQNVVVRVTGLANPDMTRHVTQQIGFTLHQTLSINNRYDIRDDKVTRCVVNGRVLNRADLEFAENLRAVLLPGVPEGAPYAIDSQLIPVAGVYERDVYWQKEAAELVDQRVSDYLTLKLPEYEWTEPSAIESRYQVVSPVVSILLADFAVDALEAPATDVDNNRIIELFEPYRPWLIYDPCVRGVDDNFVVVVPHHFGSVVTVTLEQYAFIERVIHLYLNDKVDLTHFLEIGTNPVDTNVDPFWENVIYQLRFEGAVNTGQIVDDKPNLWVALNNAQLVGSGDPKFGTMLQLNTPTNINQSELGDLVYTNDVSEATLDGDFTLEWWLQTNQDAHDNVEIVMDTSSPQGDGPYSIPGGWFQIYLHWNAGVEIYVGIENQYYQTMISAEGCLTLGQLNHVAWVRKNGVSKLFVNGTNVTSTYIPDDFPYVDGGVVDNHVYTGVNQWILGKWLPAGSNWPVRNVWMDNFRLTKGAARYETNFDPNDIEYHIPD